MNEIQMESANDERDKALTKHLLLPDESSSAGNELYLIEMLAKGAPLNPQTTKATV